MSGLVAVTGATGFLGRHIVRALGQQGWRVRILTRQYPVHAQFSGLTFEAIAGDLSDTDALSALVAHADVVVHAAGLIKARSADQFWQANVQGTENLIAAMNKAARPQRLVLVSSMAARAPHLSPYASAKRAAEERVRSLLDMKHAFIIVRPCAIYGPWDNETLMLFQALNRRFTALPQSSGARICLVHVRDVAEAVAAFCAEGEAGRLFEITDARVEGYGRDEIKAAAAAALGIAAYSVALPAWAIRLGGALGTLAARLNIATPMLTRDKAEEIIHRDWGSTPDKQPPAHIWQPKIDIKGGFSETVKWYRENGRLSARDTPMA